jgi:hypothetical protein
MKLDSSIFDITKSLALIALVVFLFMEIPKMVSNFTGRDDKNPVDITTIENIATNAAVATVAANNADIKKLTEQLAAQNSVLLKTIKANNERVDEIGKVTATLSGKVDWLSKATTYKDPENPKRDLEEVTVNLNDAEGSPYPVAVVRLSPNIQGAERWSVEPHKLEVKTDIVETTDDDGNPKRYAEAWVENHWSSLGKNEDGTYKKFPIDLTIDNWAKRVEKEKKFWYSPRIGFSGIFGTDTAVGLDLGIFSYGKTRADSDWQFIAFGAAKASDTELMYFTPVKYNIGKLLPLMENLFIGPTVYLDKDSNYSAGVSISTLF